MKQNVLKIASFILSFTIGIAFVWLYFSNFPKIFYSIFSRESTFTTVRPGQSLKPFSEQVQIKFLSSEKRNAPNYVFVKFQIVNNSSATLYYSGYSKDWHCSYKFRRGTKVDEPQGLICNCAVGLAERSLSPGETAIYDVAVLPQSKTEKIQVGFDFEVGRERRKETIWTDEVIVSK